MKNIPTRGMFFFSKSSKVDMLFYGGEMTKRDPIHGLTEAEANEIMPNGQSRVVVDPTRNLVSIYALDKLEAYERGRAPRVTRVKGKGRYDR